jgi:hypothetical protein
LEPHQTFKQQRILEQGTQTTRATQEAQGTQTTDLFVVTIDDKMEQQRQDKETQYEYVSQQEQEAKQDVAQRFDDDLKAQRAKQQADYIHNKARFESASPADMEVDTQVKRTSSSKGSPTPAKKATVSTDMEVEPVAQQEPPIAKAKSKRKPKTQQAQGSSIRSATPRAKAIKQPADVRTPSQQRETNKKTQIRYTTTSTNIKSTITTATGSVIIKGTITTTSRQSATAKK